MFRLDVMIPFFFKSPFNSIIDAIHINSNSEDILQHSDVEISVEWLLQRAYMLSRIVVNLMGLTKILLFLEANFRGISENIPMSAEK